MVSHPSNTSRERTVEAEAKWAIYVLGTIQNGTENIVRNTLSPKVTTEAVQVALNFIMSKGRIGRNQNSNSYLATDGIYGPASREWVGQYQLDNRAHLVNDRPLAHDYQVGEQTAQSLIANVTRILRRPDPYWDFQYRQNGLVLPPRRPTELSMKIARGVLPQGANRENTVVILNSGHAGKGDPGATLRLKEGGVATEADIAAVNTRAIKQSLERKGFTVRVVSGFDMHQIDPKKLIIPETARREFTKEMRASSLKKIIGDARNAGKNAVIIGIEVNSKEGLVDGDDKQRLAIQGAEVLYTHSESKGLAEVFDSAVAEASGVKNRTLLKRPLYALRPNAYGVIVELGFIHQPEVRDPLSNRMVLQRYAITNMLEKLLPPN